MNYRIFEMLEDAIQDIYIKLQSEMKIKDGGVPVEYMVDEAITTEKLADIIARTLNWQKEAR